LLLLVTPALDPALQMDADFLTAVNAEAPELPTVTVLTQVDRLRPVREWQPPYDWQTGNRPKEKAIREATAYRTKSLGKLDIAGVTVTVPVVTRGPDRAAWNTDVLSQVLVDAISTSKQVRLARFLRDQEARIRAAAQIIDRYSFQMSTTQGLTALLKSPILRYLSMMMTGSDLLAQLLIKKIPIEQAPVVIGKLQMAYDLYSLLSAKRFGRPPDASAPAAVEAGFDLLTLWPLLLDTSTSPQQDAWALGHTLVEYWTQGLRPEQLQAKYQEYQAQ
jgi:predicted GTPase